MALEKSPSCNSPNLFRPIPPLRTNINSKMSCRRIRWTNSSIRAEIRPRSYNWLSLFDLHMSFPWMLSMRSAKSIHSSCDNASFCCFCRLLISRERELKFANSLLTIAKNWPNVTIPVSNAIALHNKMEKNEKKGKRNDRRFKGEWIYTKYV